MTDQLETERLAELRSYNILDTSPEPQFDSIVALACVLFDTPIAAVTFVDSDRQWFKARAGMVKTQTPREESFCSHAMENDGVFVVPDAQKDPRFADFANVTGAPNIRFYAGAPLRSPNGHNLGAVCVISDNPRGELSSTDKKKLELLADIVGNEIELKKQANVARQSLSDHEAASREAQLRIKTSLDYATLLAEVQSDTLSTEQLTAFARTAWQQYSEAGGILMSSIKSLRNRLPPQAYKSLLENMPGFIV